MANITVQQFQPSEIIAIFNEILAHQNNQASGKLVCIRGLYLKGNGIPVNNNRKVYHRKYNSLKYLDASKISCIFALKKRKQ